MDGSAVEQATDAPIHSENVACSNGFDAAAAVSTVSQDANGSSDGKVSKPNMLASLKQAGAVDHTQVARLVFLFKLKEGTAPASFGLNVSVMAGVPPSVVHRAAAIVAQLQSTDASASTQAAARDAPCHHQGVKPVASKTIEEGFKLCRSILSFTGYFTRPLSSQPSLQDLCQEAAQVARQWPEIAQVLLSVVPQYAVISSDTKATKNPQATLKI
eukprot:TRINITY_DN70761_c0_g1_i1.p1 TRINITY_DN70761_c0_g1~~TRINITY_DN70761_c0_g1_i1.p1  ORF type:complete len:215 (-),score=23.75 TRINITY_DN70761_c0_g1_i1:63-707(-)